MFLKSKEEIKKWLDNYKIKNYTINNDLTIDVNDNVNLRDKKLTNIPIKFNIVTGNFWCSNNKITSLEFAPKEVGGSFRCNMNKITTLEYSPVTGEVNKK
jgi:hypothetical protein